MYRFVKENRSFERAQSPYTEENLNVYIFCESSFLYTRLHAILFASASGEKLDYCTLLWHGCIILLPQWYFQSMTEAFV